MDPVEFRLKNTPARGSVTSSGYHLSTFAPRTVSRPPRRCRLEREERANCRPERGSGRPRAICQRRRRRHLPTDIPHSTVLIRVAEDGTGVIVHTGSNEIGQGSDTVMAMIAGEVLGLSPLAHNRDLRRYRPVSH